MKILIRTTSQEQTKQFDNSLEKQIVAIQIYRVYAFKSFVIIDYYHLLSNRCEPKTIFKVINHESRKILSF